MFLMYICRIYEVVVVTFSVNDPPRLNQIIIDYWNLGTSTIRG